MERRIRNLVFLNEDREKQIDIAGEKWKILALFEKENLEVARAAAFSRNGLAENAFSADDRYRFHRAALVNAGVVTGPDWWENSESCPETETLEKLYTEITGWTKEFQDRLKKNRLTGRGKSPTVPS